MNYDPADPLSPINRSEQTQKLLAAISDRLSSRQDCMLLEYTVTIDYRGVTMQPLVTVFPDIHHRQESDRIDIISFIHRYRMQDATLDQFEFGVYRYEHYTSKKRRWVRVQ